MLPLVILGGALYYLSRPNRNPATGRWIAGALAKHKPGSLHRQLGVPEGETIPVRTLEVAAKAGGLVGKRARLALTLRRLSRGKG